VLSFQKTDTFDIFARKMWSIFCLCRYKCKFRSVQDAKTHWKVDLQL